LLLLVLSSLLVQDPTTTISSSCSALATAELERTSER
jgi:hypothetical protein